MPTYEYECLECKHKFEVFQSMKDDPVEKCIKCNNKVRRLFGSGVGIIFKGSGFYVNDYKNKSAVNSSKKTSKTEKTDSDKGIEKKSDKATESCNSEVRSA